MSMNVFLVKQINQKSWEINILDNDLISYFELFYRTVENIGVEPMTSWMQIKRSSQLS